AADELEEQRKPGNPTLEKFTEILADMDAKSSGFEFGVVQIYLENAPPVFTQERIHVGAVIGVPEPEPETPQRPWFRRELESANFIQRMGHDRYFLDGETKGLTAHLFAIHLAANTF